MFVCLLCVYVYNKVVWPLNSRLSGVLRIPLAVLGLFIHKISIKLEKNLSGKLMLTIICYLKVFVCLFVCAFKIIR